MSSSLQTLLELRRDAERAARVDLERAIATRVKEEKTRDRLVEIWRAARAALLRSRGQPRLYWTRKHRRPTGAIPLKGKA